MRLHQREINIIKELTSSFFGNDNEVMLFGSRVDDNLKGGDQKIDLVISRDKKRPIEQEAINKKVVL